MTTTPRKNNCGSWIGGFGEIERGGGRDKKRKREGEHFRGAQDTRQETDDGRTKSGQIYTIRRSAIPRESGWVVSHVRSCANTSPRTYQWYTWRCTSPSPSFRLPCERPLNNSRSLPRPFNGPSSLLLVLLITSHAIPLALLPARMILSQPWPILTHRPTESAEIEIEEEGRIAIAQRIKISL